MQHSVNVVASTKREFLQQPCFVVRCNIFTNDDEGKDLLIWRGALCMAMIAIYAFAFSRFLPHLPIGLLVREKFSNSRRNRGIESAGNIWRHGKCKVRRADPSFLLGRNLSRRTRMKEVDMDSSSGEKLKKWAHHHLQQQALPLHRLNWYHGFFLLWRDRSSVKTPFTFRRSISLTSVLLMWAKKNQ